MPITSRWGRNREHQLIAFLGGGGVRVVCVHCFWHHAAEYDDGAGEVRGLLLRVVRRRSVSGGLGDGADPAVGQGQFSVLSSHLPNAQFCFDVLAILGSFAVSFGRAKTPQQSFGGFGLQAVARG